jgi:hypothetical protein
LTGNPTASLSYERLSKISMPHVARNVRANTAPGQLARAVQVGKMPPASQYFAGGIRIGVLSLELRSRTLVHERTDSDEITFRG